MSELVKALRCCASKSETCSECEYQDEYSICIDKLMQDAADTIDRLTAENADLLQKTQQLTETNKALESDNYNAEMNLSRLTERLGMAKADLKIMALAMRESDELSEGCCFACICDGQNLPDGTILPYGECPGYEKNDCFVWRGEESE